MTAWRLCRRRFAELDGEGARRFGGRWNPPGLPAVYLAESLSLAALECLVHFDVADAPSDYVAIEVAFEAGLVESVDRSGLPADWRSGPVTRWTRSFGERWLREARSLVLEVPSVVIPRERNYVLNPLHPSRDALRLEAPIPFDFDARLFIS